MIFNFYAALLAVVVCSCHCYWLGTQNELSAVDAELPYSGDEPVTLATSSLIDAYGTYLDYDLASSQHLAKIATENAEATVLHFPLTMDSQKP